MAEPMTAAAMLPLLQAWKRQHDALAKQMAALEAVVGGGLDAPLFAAVWTTFEAYTDQLAHRIGDQKDWLQWFCNENLMGRNGLTATSWSRSIKVRTLRQLATVIVGSRN